MSKTVHKLRTRAQWAARIRAAHMETVSAILKLGRMLSAAKDALKHGEFLQMIKDDLPFTASTAQRLMKIAADPNIANAARAQLLPPHWGALYELTKLPAGAFEQAAATGAIHPKMTREDVKTVSVAYSHTPPETKTIRFATHQEARQPSLPTSLRVETFGAAPLLLLEKLERLERLVADLSTDVQNGDVAVGSAVERRIRAAANKLLSLIGQSSESLN